MMMFSNVFLILPVIFSAMYHEWLYFFFAAGLVIFSPLYHWYKFHRPNSTAFPIFMWCDTAFALGAFLYMYFYVYRYTPQEFKLLLFGSLSAVVLFFWYGRRADYDKLHPWFHIIAPIISSSILVLTHLK